MTNAIQRAIGALSIRDVYLRDSRTHLAEGFEPKYDEDLENLDVQFQHVVTQTSVLELEQEGEETVSLFRVYVQLGARWMDPKSPSDDPDADAPRALIAGVMVAEYEMKDDPGEEALREFALRNASYHVWPYWRELLASQCMRMNLPKLVLPAVQFALRPDSATSPG